MNRLIQFLWLLLLFTLPFSRHLVLYEAFSYRFGHFNPWVTGFLYLPEILLVLVFLFWGIEKIRQREIGKFRWPSLGFWLLKAFVLNAGLITWFKGDFTLFLFFGLKLTLAYLFYVLLRAEIVPLKKTLAWLLMGAGFQIVIAFLQLRFNHSVGLAVIGEPHVSAEILNVAKNDLADGSKHIRGYGTFLHPNILAAYLLTLLLVSWPHLKRWAFVLWPPVLLFGLYLAGSQAAFLVLGGLILLYLLSRLPKDTGYKKFFAFGFLTLFLAANAWFYFNAGQLQTRDSSLSERLEQFSISRSMIEAEPWGVGVGNFTLKMEEFSPEKLAPWEFQPVHNVYVLVMNEMGLQGFVILMLMIITALYAYFKPSKDYTAGLERHTLPLFGLLLLASFDHLLFTSYLGMLLVALVLVAGMEGGKDVL